MLVIIAISIFTVSYFTYLSLEKVIINELNDNAKKTLQSVEEHFLSNFMGDMAFVVHHWAESPELKSYKDFPGQPHITRNIPAQFLEIHKQWMGFTISQPDIAWIYFATESDGSIFIAPTDPTMPLDYDARTRDWYKGAVANTGSIHWSEPYLDAGESGEYIVTAAKTVHKNGKRIGVVAVDIKLKKFSSIVRQIRYGDGNKGYLMLVNKNGIVFASPNANMLTKNISNLPWIRTILDTMEGHQNVSIDGVDMIVTHTTNKETGWKLIGVQPLNMASRLESVKERGIQIGLFSLLLTFMISTFFATHFTRPIDKLMKVIGKVAKGDMDVRAKLRTGDEMQTLSEHLNGMLDNIQELMVEREDHVKTLEFKNYEIIQQREEISIFSEETEAMNEELLHLVEEIKGNYLNTVTALANAIEASDSYTRGHCERVTHYALAIGRTMDLSQSRLTNLEFASILHDIGKIGISTELLNKTGQLTPDEFETIRSHPVIGYDILKDIPFMKESSAIIFQHHERVDGKGYPLGLIGEDIELCARILTVADAYDAMTSSRPYRKSPLTLDRAREQLIMGKGTQFDAQIVDALLLILETESPLSQRTTHSS